MSRPASSTAAIGVLALLALPVGEAAAQGHEAAPPPAPAKDFALPAQHELRLPNGMQVTLVQYGPLPLATLTLVVRTGSIDERPNEVWVSKLMADFLQQGTTTRPAAALAEAAAGMGGSLTVQAGDDASTIAGTALGDSAASFVRLMADVIQHPRFPESEFSRLRADRLRELAIAHTQPQQLAEERYAAMIYPDHPYGRLDPTEEALQSYTPLMVRDFYAREVGAARAHLYVVGRFDIKALEAAARQSFAGWPAGRSATINPPPAPHAERALAVIDRPNAVQSTVDLGIRVPDPSSPSWIPLDVTDALLGGSYGSRITSNIREDKGYTYSPFSFVQSHYQSAVWTETADVTTNVTGASLKEIFGEIDRLRATPPSTDELRGIQNYLAGIFVLRSATREGLTRQFEFVDLHGLGGSYLSSYVRRVYAVTPADVREIAERYLDPAKMTIVVAGDQKTIANQLAPYAKTVQ